MKKEIMSMPWMAKNAKKKNAYNVCAKMVGDQLVIDFSDKKPFMRTVLTQKSFENFFPNERIIKKSYYDEETVFGTNKKSITSIFGYDTYSLNVNASEETTKLIIDFCGFQTESIISAIYSLQGVINTEKQNRAYQNHQEKLNEFLSQVKKTPQSFYNWCERKLTTHYVLTKPFNGKKTTTGLTSCCNNEITINKGEIIKKCPVCGKKVQMTRKSKINASQKDFILMQKSNDLLLKRHYEASYEVGTNSNGAYEEFNIYEKGFDSVNLKTGEQKRIFAKRNLWTQTDFYDDKNLYGMNCIKFLPGITKNLSLLTNMPEFKYSGIEYLDIVEPFDYLARYVKLPQLEMLAKVGLQNLAKTISKDFMTTEYKKPWEMLKVNKVCFNKMREIDATLSELIWFQYITKTGIEVDVEDIKFFTGRYYFTIYPDNLDFIYPKMSYKQIRNYIEKQQKFLPGYHNTYSIISIWRDYCDMAKNFKKDMSLEINYKPKNVVVAHDELATIDMSIKREKEILENFPNVNEIISTLSKYAYSDGEYSIVVPNDIKDIIKEGKILGHCVGNADIYFDRISRHESYIVFLRKNENIDAPFYTLEIEPDGTTRQKRTYGDTQDKNYKSCVGFIRKWQSYVKTVISDTDMEYQKESAILREANFKELRETKAEIRHGLFQGRLLAEVLEQDLMLA